MSLAEQVIWLLLRWFANALTAGGIIGSVGLIALAIFQSIENLIDEKEK